MVLCESFKTRGICLKILESRNIKTCCNFQFGHKMEAKAFVQIKNCYPFPRLKNQIHSCFLNTAAVDMSQQEIANSDLTFLPPARIAPFIVICTNNLTVAPSVVETQAAFFFLILFPNVSLSLTLKQILCFFVFNIKQINLLLSSACFIEFVSKWDLMITWLVQHLPTFQAPHIENITKKTVLRSSEELRITVIVPLLDSTCYHLQTPGLPSSFSPSKIPISFSSSQLR